MKNSVVKSDWFSGLVITLAILAFNGTDFIASLERGAYDFGVRSSAAAASDKIAIIAIDDRSISNLGRWPWSRDIHARMHDILAGSDASVIGQTVFFSEPQLDPGLSFIRQLKQQFTDSSMPSVPQLLEELSITIENSRSLVKNKRDANGQAAVEKIAGALSASALQQVEHEVDRYLELISSAEVILDTDSMLATSIKNAGNVIFNMPFTPGQGPGLADTPLPDYISKNKLDIDNIVDKATTKPQRHSPVRMIEAYQPIAVLGQQAAAIGALIALPDVDGAIRSEPLVIDYYGEYYPSMALLLAASSMNLGSEDIHITAGSDVRLGRLKIKTDSNSLMNTFFYEPEKGDSAFVIDSFYDVLQGKIPVHKYRDKIILIGATALGVGNTFVTPIDPAMHPVVTLAHTVSSILNEDFFIEPQWGIYARFGTIVIIALYIMLVLPRLSAITGFIVSSFLLCSLFISHYLLMTQHGMWLQLMLPALLLGTGHILLTTKRFFLSEESKKRLDIESAENHRMLGLSLQGQGQLDMAFEKFRKLPLENSALELLYNLALDYERKRQFNRAKSVYDYMTNIDTDFRDIKQRAGRALSLEQGFILGAASNSPAGVTSLHTGAGIETPMLGRYEIERELGKGAMGAVYLGRDPKISRTVAIKTMALSQEFAEDELAEVKQRFFREAKTAGRLTHPNIVTIYDAGEEHDLAYIAMEFLKGDDLTRYIKAATLLPVKQVLTLIRQAAEAIDYAHQQNVVHRDIKPANIMWDPETGSLKITDFGIARITDASRTKTGMVLGTPSYMSPEQLAGKKVSGQSDIFSLGIMLFQMVTGKLPFSGDSMASLMYKIANEQHPSADSINPDIPRCVCIIINRALAKDIEKRYQRARQMATDIDKCLKIMAAEGRE